MGNKRAGKKTLFDTPRFPTAFLISFLARIRSSGFYCWSSLHRTNSLVLLPKQLSSLQAYCDDSNCQLNASAYTSNSLHCAFQECQFSVCQAKAEDKNWKQWKYFQSAFIDDDNDDTQRIHSRLIPEDRKMLLMAKHLMLGERMEVVFLRNFLIHLCPLAR